MTPGGRAGVAAQHRRLARLPAARPGSAEHYGLPRRRRQRRQGAGPGRGVGRCGRRRRRLRRDGRVDRRRRRDRARRPAARRRRRQRRPHRPRDRRARRPAVRVRRAGLPRGRGVGLVDRGDHRARRRPRRRVEVRRAHRARSSVGPSRRSPTCSTCGSPSSPARSRSGYGDDFFDAAQAELDRSARISTSPRARASCRAGCGDDGPAARRRRGRLVGPRADVGAGYRRVTRARNSALVTPSSPRDRGVPSADPRRSSPTTCPTAGPASAACPPTRCCRSSTSGARCCTRNGLLAPSWPAEYGGGGLTHVETVILVEEFARSAPPPAAPTTCSTSG